MMEPMTVDIKINELTQAGASRYEVVIDGQVSLLTDSTTQADEQRVREYVYAFVLGALWDALDDDCEPCAPPYKLH